MLSSFKVKNFRSFRDEQEFSMEAYWRHSQGLKTHAWSTGRDDTPYLLKTAAIFGANASGKSNLLKAIQFMKHFVLQEVTNAGLGVVQSLMPFMLDRVSQDQPTKFEISLLISGVRYQYGFSILKTKILREYLIVYRQKKAQTWFDRSWDAENHRYQYKYSAHFKGSKKTWEETTRETVLYLSTAVALNSSQLKPIYEWFRHQLVVINDIESLNHSFTINQLKSGKDKDLVLRLLQSADLSIADIGIKTKQAPVKNVVFDTQKNTVEISDELVESDQIFFGHRTDDGVKYLPFDQESMGTKKFFFLAGPLLDILHSKEVTFLIDELDTSLHPMLVEKIVEIFETESDRQAGSQLIFTTHCETLLTNKTGNTQLTPLLRRDQVWFVSKDRMHVSSLYSLLEFKVRPNESVREGYRRGRFDAIPMIDELKIGVS